jgi:GDP-4-dehydro-6-deoxy-D-mannose reductase
MKVLITGASGFSGTHTVDFLSSKEDITIIGLARKTPVHCHSAKNVSWIEGDILDPVKISDTISVINPDAVLHLAGLNRGSFQELQRTNITGTQNILDSTLEVNPDCHILVISSSAVYGYAGNTPITETQVLKPLSDYGASKAAQETLCQMYQKNKECQVAVARPFNLVGPYQPASFVCGRIIQQIIEIEHGKRTSLDLLEIQSCRDFIDVRDAVKAYWALLSHAKFKENCAGKAFNIGSGKTYSVSTVIDLLQEIAGKEFPVHLPQSFPPAAIPSQKSDNSLIHRITGWNPLISLKDSLSDMLDAARKDQYS